MEQFAIIPPQNKVCLYKCALKVIVVLLIPQERQVYRKNQGATNWKFHRFSARVLEFLFPWELNSEKRGSHIWILGGEFSISRVPFESRSPTLVWVPPIYDLTRFSIYPRPPTGNFSVTLRLKTILSLRLFGLNWVEWLKNANTDM